MLAKHKASLLEKFLTNLSPNDGSLWRATKRTCKLNSLNVPIKKSDGSFVCTDWEKVELFKDFLHETFQPHPEIFSLENNFAVAESLSSPLPVSCPVKHFSPSEVKFVIDKYPQKKSPGFDLITGKVARCLPKKAILYLTHIFNSILRLSYFPILWKFSTIIMIPKPKKPSHTVSSFRPISLLPFFAKILEKLILKRILPSISNSVLPDTQFSFCSAHSTIYQVYRIVDVTSFSLEKKQYCTCAFLDFSQAFDRV
jgi:hypothetical protein